MKPWRKHPDDPWREAERLEVKRVCERLGWTKRRLTTELDKVASEDAFLTRVMRAVNDLDPPRLLHRDSSRGYTKIPQEAMPNEPEAVPPDYQEALSKGRREAYTAEQTEKHQARKRQSLAVRIVLLEKEAGERGATRSIASHLRVIERHIEQAERKVLKSVPSG